MKFLLLISPHIFGILCIFLAVAAFKKNLWRGGVLIPLMVFDILAYYVVDMMLVGIASGQIDGLDPFLILRLIYIPITLIPVFIVTHFLSTSTSQYSRYFASWIWIVVAPLIFFLIVPGPIIAGYTLLPYSVTRIPGDFYWVWQVVTFIFLMSAVVLLVIRILFSQDSEDKDRSLIVGLGVFPTVFFALFVLLAMQLGFKINASLVLHSVLFLVPVSVFISRSEIHRVRALLSYIPFTPEYKAISTIRSSIVNSSKAVLDETIRSVEAVIIRNSLAHNNGNRTRTADSLGISRPTLKRKMKQAGIT